MNINDLYQAFDGIDEEILERSEVAETPGKQRAFTFKRRVLAACIAVLVLTVGIAGLAFAAEAKEYSTAVDFFEENGLSTEGLSREDIKAVYRDITTRRFEYGKTAEVIVRTVPGWDISQKKLTPDELAALWKRNCDIGSTGTTDTAKDQFVYTTDYLDKSDDEHGFLVFDRSLLNCHRGGRLIWTAEFTEFIVDDACHTSAGTAVWGFTYRISNEESSPAWIARVSENGTVLWKHQLEHGATYCEDVVQIIENRDGSWAVISRLDFEHLCLSQYDVDGNERSFQKTHIGKVGVLNAISFGDGYLVQASSFEEGGKARLIKLDRAGNLIDDFSYTAEDCDYTITDMAEFEGKMYLSAYATPKCQSDSFGRDEIAGILDYVFDNYPKFDIPSEELTPLVQNNYTAVLLVCDPAGGAPETFYSAKGSLGDKLSVNDGGELVWTVHSVYATFFSPATSSFTIGGRCQVLRYTFDTDGKLISHKNTGETVPYRR